MAFRHAHLLPHQRLALPHCITSKTSGSAHSVRFFVTAAFCAVPETMTVHSLHTSFLLLLSETHKRMGTIRHEKYGNYSEASRCQSCLCFVTVTIPTLFRIAVSPPFLSHVRIYVHNTASQTTPSSGGLGERELTNG